MKLVLDTNTVISGFLWYQAPRQIINAAVEGHIELVTSAALLDELSGVIARAKFSRKIDEHGVSVSALVDRYTRLTTIITPAQIGRMAVDPDDDAVLACALAAGADIIVSGDKPLLNLKSYQRIPILTSTDALARISKSIPPN